MTSAAPDPTTRRVADLVAALEAIAPSRLAEPWDNVGLLVGDPAAPLGRVLLCVDLTRAVLTEARAAGCEAIVSYHPPLFRPLKRVTAGSLAYELVRAGVAVYSPHTALDVAEGGTNDALAEALGLSDCKPLRKGQAPGEWPAGWGLGRVGRVEGATRGEFVERVKRALGLASVLVAGPLEGEARLAAVGAGACGDLLDDVLAAGADVYVTGEVRHHDALRAAEAGLTLVCTLHSNSERGALGRLGERLAAALPGLDWSLSGLDADPFRVR
ncbi:MAG TPA: Nif3-like dinuclear metal center hexameric protein [Polyangiaceae bacterium]|nr:Nif3-like dinuclear metal center hexameric protein [Polyangiaceae bacterium]